MRRAHSESAVDKVLAVFFQAPTARVHLRELARRATLSAPATATACETLIKGGVLIKQETPPTVSYSALRDLAEFRMRKRLWNLKQILQSGIIEQLLAAEPEAIILAGSYSRGEDTEQDRITLVLVNPQKRAPHIAQREKRLARSISILELRQPWDKELANEAANGIVVHGRWNPL